MQFVNITRKTVYTSYSGTLSPGRVSADGGKKRRQLEEVLDDIVKTCGNSLGIRLNSREVELVNKLMTLDEKGSGFKFGSLPREIREDPTGEKANEKAIMAAQQREMDELGRRNAEAARREAEINGEVLPGRKAVGPATLGDEGEPVDPSKLKSGFEQIMEENARIASRGKKDVGEILDPIGRHATGAAVPETHDAPAGREPAVVNMARGLDGDATKSADATVPEAIAAGRGNAMDRKAAEMAGKLSHIGPEPKAKGKGKGKGKK